MTELLTESFCERCGTRYTFESSAPRRSRFARVRTLSKGVKNFVLSDDSSFSEAMAEARSEEEILATSHQLDAFHRTFNFCMTCRQYTCGDCWNLAEGRCMTCAPLPEQEQPVALFGLGAEAGPLFEPHADGNGRGAPVPIGAWPRIDLPAGPVTQAPPTLQETALEAAPEAPAEAPAEMIAEAERVAGQDEAVEAEAVQTEAVTAEAVEAAAPVAAADQIVSPPIRGMVAGQSLDEALAAYEAMLAAEEAEAARAAAAVVEPEPEPVPEPKAEAAREAAAVVEPEPEPVPEPVAAAAVVEPEPEPVAAAAVVEPEPEPEPEPVAPQPAPPAHDRIEQPTWTTPAQPFPPTRPVAPAPQPAPAPAPTPWLTVAPDDAAPQWTAAPQWPSPSARRAAPATFAGRPILPQVDATALWAASAREVLGAAPAALAATAPVPTAQPCVNCGLSLSANARFCRRCGSRQG